MVWKGNAPMPSCNATHQQEILDAVDTLRGSGRQAAEELLHDLGAETLCRILHAMRRWYSYNCWNAAKKIIPHRRALAQAMDLDPEDAVGAFRGIRVPLSSPLADADRGDEYTLPMERNGGCSSWTLQRKFANRFSGKQPGKAGIVIRLADTRGVKPFIAPPCRTERWFDSIYAKTMGRSFRFNEMEYAIAGNRQIVEIVDIKR